MLKRVPQNPWNGYRSYAVKSGLESEMKFSTNVIVKCTERGKGVTVVPLTD